MKEVKLFLTNIQSHKNTCITLKPGLTLLVAKDNNVGKSTIMRVLDIIAQIHHLKAEDIRPMLRYGAEEGIIHCEFDNQIVELHIFLSNTTVKYYFLHQKDGVVTQHDKAPKELIQALNLIAPDDIEQTLNIIEADKYQVIIDEGNVNDSVISFLFTDQMVEHMKENAVILSNLLSNDEKFYSLSFSKEKEKLGTLAFNPYAEQFFADKEMLFLISRFVDALPNYQYLRKAAVHSYPLKRLEQTLHFMELLQSLEISKLSSKKVEYLITISHLITILERLQKTSTITQYQSNHLTRLLSCVQTLDDFTVLLKQYWALAKDTQELLSNKSQLLQQLSKSYRTVVCPVKGEVIYHEKGCLPTHD